MEKINLRKTINQLLSQQFRCSDQPLQEIVQSQGERSEFVLLPPGHGDIHFSNSFAHL